VISSWPVRPSTYANPASIAFSAETRGWRARAETLPHVSVPIVTRLPWLMLAATRPKRTGTPRKACGMLTCHRSAVTRVALAAPSWETSIPSTSRYSPMNARVASATTASSTDSTLRPRAAPSVESVTWLPTAPAGDERDRAHQVDGGTRARIDEHVHGRSVGGGPGGEGLERGAVRQAVDDLGERATACC
jgi:hypothetical protein